MTPTNDLNILYNDEFIIAIDKPQGFHVHPHQTHHHKICRSLICLYLVRDHLGQQVFPIHRLDAGTSGVLIFAKSSEAASRMSSLVRDHQIAKTYWALVRGNTPTEGTIQIPLLSQTTDKLLEAQTHYKKLKTLKLTKGFYSWLEVKPTTGRYHQIRRHMNRISHPLIGDAQHGDSRHNQYFRNEFRISGLCLRATELQFVHPWTNSEISIHAPIDPKWTQIQNLFSDFAQT